ncbi:MAG: 30S ribosomal protein S18 [Candidatus Calescibacterium sp.]|nr:30S ribosomal protein S18 [Candidatus Calescibacterium sp.]MCX7972317.1 30S ribosomal protein S18 [bacterium]MDW8195079.1 30S ribosomal protein S18 [Candidatus Calescibacterium sp.]
MPKKKKCPLCEQKIEKVDYKRVDLLTNFISDKYKILPKRNTKNCSKCQRKVAQAIKRARMVALLPFVPKV